MKTGLRGAGHGSAGRRLRVVVVPPSDSEGGILQNLGVFSLYLVSAFPSSLALWTGKRGPHFQVCSDCTHLPVFFLSPPSHLYVQWAWEDGDGQSLGAVVLVC